MTIGPSVIWRCVLCDTTTTTDGSEPPGGLICGCGGAIKRLTIEGCGSEMWAAETVLLRKLDAIRTEWRTYKADLMKRYPAKEGEAWQFTCPQHQKIDDLLAE